MRERINFSQSITELAHIIWRGPTGTTTGGHRSNAIRARLARMPSSSSIRRDGMSRRSFPSPTTSRSCRCRQNHPSSIQWKISRNSCATTGFPTASSNPTTTFSTTAVRLEQAHRHALENHVYRHARMGGTSMAMMVMSARTTRSPSTRNSAREPFRRARFCAAR